MTNATIPSPELLRKLLRYEPDTGRLFWLERPPEMFSSHRACNAWNARFSGKESFITLDTKGYCMGGILNKSYRLHRIAFTIYHGFWPYALIDHVDGNKTNNKIQNLREATASQNSCNRKATINGKSKFLGVYWHSHDKRWRAKLKSNGKQFHLGNFTCEIKAAKAYDAAAIKFHGEFANLNFPNG